MKRESHIQRDREKEREKHAGVRRQFERVRRKWESGRE